MGKNAQRRREAKEAARPNRGRRLDPSDEASLLRMAERVSVSRGLRDSSRPMVPSGNGIRTTRVETSTFDEWQAEVTAALGVCPDCGAPYDDEPNAEEWGDDRGEGEELTFVCTGPDEHFHTVERTVWRYECEH